MTVVTFFSDSNYGLFLEHLDYRVPTNMFKSDPSNLTVEFDSEVLEVAKQHAQDLGAEIDE